MLKSLWFVFLIIMFVFFLSRIILIAEIHLILFNYVIFIFYSLLYLLRIFRIIIIIIWNLSTILIYMLRSLPWFWSGLQNISMLFIEIIEELILHFSFNSFSFAFVVFGICIFKLFFFELFLFQKLCLTFLLFFHVLKLLIFINPWNRLNINCALSKGRNWLSKNFLNTGYPIHEEWFGCLTNIQVFELKDVP